MVETRERERAELSRLIKCACVLACWLMRISERAAKLSARLAQFSPQIKLGSGGTLTT